MESETKSRTVQTGLRIPAWMIERLRQNPEGLSEEVRRILQKEFDAELKYDSETRQLAADILELVRFLQSHAKGKATVAWHQHPEMHAALTSAVQTYLEHRAPKRGSAVPPLQGFKAGHGAETGRALATTFIHALEEAHRKRAELEELTARVERLRKELGE
jgi:hypothetical protein